MNITPYDVEREYKRGRGDTIAIAIMATLFIGLPVSLGFSFALTDSAWLGLMASGAMIGLPIWKNARTRSLRATTFGLNAAYRALSVGRLQEADELLLAVQRHARAPWARRLTAIQRALIAIRRGNLAEAQGHLDEAISLPLDGKFKVNAEYQLEGAYAMRAFVRAGLGDREGALGDAAWVRGRASPSPEALARVTLAEAMLLERAAERDALRTLLDRERTLLLEHTHPRERAIVRAFQRMLKAGQRSVYRMTAQSTEHTGDEPDLDDWVQRIAPSAAQFVRKQTRGRTALHPNAATNMSYQQAYAQQVAQHVASQQPRFTEAHNLRNTKSSGQRSLMIGALVAGIGALAFFAAKLVDFVGNVGTTPPPVGPTDVPITVPAVDFPIGWLLTTLVLLGVAIGVGVTRFKKARLQREMLRPKHRIAQEPERVDQAPVSRPPSRVADSASLAALTEGPDDVLAAQGYMLIALDAEKRGDWRAVLEACDRGVARLWSPQSRQEADILYPDLHALRAFALACIGQYADAETGLTWLGATYPHLERAVFRVRLIEMVHTGRVAEAAGYAEAHALELALSVREELLADIVRAVASPETAGLGEIARLKEELEKTENARVWIASISPALVGNFQGAVEADVSDIGASTYGRTAEDEAMAELEADLGIPRRQLLES